MELDLSGLDPRDREYAESLDPEHRDVVVSALGRYRRPDRIRVGDPVPPLEVTCLEDRDTVRLDELAGGRPLVLVFGSFT